MDKYFILQLDVENKVCMKLSETTYDLSETGSIRCCQHIDGTVVDYVNFVVCQVNLSHPFP